MEWRVFFPLVSNQCLAGAGVSARVQRCANSLVACMEGFVDQSQPLEERTDAYFVTTAEFGLKFRHQKKLEIKVRTHRDESFGVEIFVKDKLGKKPLAEQVHKVLRALDEHGLGHKAERHSALLSSAASVNVAKLRRCGICPYGGLEVCHVEVSLIGSSTSIDQSFPQKWISVCVEPFAAESFAEWAKTAPGKQLIASIKEMTDSLEAEQLHTDSLVNNNLIKWLTPVVGGYPLWIEYVTAAEFKSIPVPHALLDSK